MIHVQVYKYIICVFIDHKSRIIVNLFVGGIWIVPPNGCLLYYSLVSLSLMIMIIIMYHCTITTAVCSWLGGSRVDAMKYLLQLDIIYLRLNIKGNSIACDSWSLNFAHIVDDRLFVNCYNNIKIVSESSQFTVVVVEVAFVLLWW